MINEVNTIINKIIDENIQCRKIVKDCISYSVSGKSKRFRGMIVLEQVKHYYPDKYNDYSFLAGVVELIHESSLILDDMPSMDNSDYRRGKKATHTIFGTGISQLSAMYIVYIFRNLFNSKVNSLGISLDRFLEQSKEYNLGNYNSFLMETELIDGQIMDLQMSDVDKYGYIDWQYSDYLKMAEGKTGALFTTAFVLPILYNDFVCNTKNVELVKEVVKCSKMYGICFQILDDLDDFPQKDYPKNNILSYFSMEESIKEAEKYLEIAKDNLEILQKPDCIFYNLLLEKIENFKNI